MSDRAAETNEGRTDAVLGALAADGFRLQAARDHDRVLVGASSVFLLATKVVPGRAAVEGGALTGRLGDDDETVVRYGGLRGRLLAATGRLARTSSFHTEIRPVVVIWGDFPPRILDDGGIAYVHGDELAAWLRSGPAVAREFALAS